MITVNNLNGERNFEKLTLFVSQLLQQNLNLSFNVSLYREHYGTIEDVNLPAVNIFLKEVDPLRYDANTSVNNCVVSIVVYTKSENKGVENSLNGKTQGLKIIGQINNIFSKRVAYGGITGHAIQQMQAGSVRFSTPADLKESRDIIGEQQILITVNETNDEKFSEILQQTHTQLNGNLDINVPIVLSGSGSV